MKTYLLLMLALLPSVYLTIGCATIKPQPPNLNEDGNLELYLLQSYANDDEEAFRLALSQGANPNLLLNNGSIPLLKDAIQKKHRSRVNALLNYDVDVNAQDEYGATPLFASIRNDWFELTQKLLDRGADPWVVTWGHQTTLLDYVRTYGSKPVIEMMAERMKEFPTCRQQAELLVHAIRSGDFQKVREISNANPDAINCIDRQGTAPLIVAILEGNTTVVASLLEKGANPEIVNYRGEFPLILAVEGNKSEIFGLLLQHTNHINQRSYEKNTALHFAVASKQLTFVKRLVENGANPNAINIEGFSPLMLSVKKDWYSGFRLLLDYGGRIELRNFFDQSAIDLTRPNSDPRIVKILHQNSSPATGQIQ